MKDNTERRQNKRFEAQEDVFAILGEGASRMGRILEISGGGLSFTYRTSGKEDVSSRDMLELSILSDTYGASIKEPFRFNVKIISEIESEDQNQFGEAVVKRCGLQFNDLTFYQKAWLSECIKNYTTGQVPEK